MIFSIYDFISLFFAVLALTISIFSIFKSSYFLKFSNSTAIVTRKEFEDCANICVSGSLTIANLGSVATKVKLSLFINNFEFGVINTILIPKASKESYSFEFKDSHSKESLKNIKLVVSSPSKDKSIFIVPINLDDIDSEFME